MISSPLVIQDPSGATREMSARRLTARARPLRDCGVTQRVLGVEEDVRKPRSVLEGRQVIKLLLEGRRPRE